MEWFKKFLRETFKKERVKKNSETQKINELMERYGIKDKEQLEIILAEIAEEKTK